MTTAEMVELHEARKYDYQNGRVVVLDGEKEEAFHALTAQRLRDLDAMLRKHQWREARPPIQPGEPAFCIECDRYEPYHDEDCPLAALLEGGE